MEHLPFYLSIGMPYDLFWNGDVWLAAVYYRAHQLAVQRKSEEMWLQGLYNFAAVSVAVGNALRKKGARAKSYPEEPIRLTPYTEGEKAALAERERRKAIAYFDNMQKKWERAKCPVPSAERRPRNEHRIR